MLILVALFSGCALLLYLGRKPKLSPPAQPKTQVEAKVEGQDFPLLLKDPSGLRLELKRAPVRIISLTLGTDEMLLALVAPERIAGLTHLVDDPRASCATEQAKAVKNRVTANAEEILLASPDLVLVATYTQAAQVKLLAKSGAPIWRFGTFNSLDDLRQNIRMLSRLCGVRKRGEQLIQQMDARLRRVRERIPKGRRPRVLFVTKGLWTAGKGTTVHDILTAAGAINLAALKGREGWSKMSAEEVIDWNPEIVIAQTQQAKTIPAHTWLARQPGLAELPAVKNQRVWAVPARAMTSVSQHVVEAVEAVQKVLFR